MNVLLCIREDYMKNFAGDSMQLIMTSKYLNKLGVNVTINSGNIADYSSYDLIHLFNLTRVSETYRYYKIACYYKKKIVISPIYWNLEPYYYSINDIKSLFVWKKWEPYRKIILEQCNAIYPNSEIESIHIKNQFGENLKCTVIYNGVEVNEYTPRYDFKKRYNLNDYVLCSARICQRKNQQILASICNELGIDLVLIGNINDNTYFEKCIKFKNVHYLGYMNNLDLYNAYSFAKLHVLPSFVETPGLSSLEAALNGCTIVSTEIGSAIEYFNDMALYCNPYNYTDILKTIDKGLNYPKNDNLKKHIIQNYSWEKCLKLLYESYISLFNSL